MKPVSRKTATYINLGFQYLMMVLMIVRGLVIPPLAAFYIDHDLLGAWFASGNIIQWIMISEGGAWLYLRQRTALEYGRGDSIALSSVVGTGAVLMFAIGFVIAIIGLSLAPSIPGWMNVEVKYSSELILAFSLTVVGMGLGLPAVIPRAIAHGLQRQTLVNTNLLIAEITSLGVSLWMLIDGYGVVALGVGPLVREIVQTILNWPAFIVLINELSIRPSISWAYFKNMSGNMGWAFLNNLSMVMRKNVDAIIVSQVFGNSSVLIVEWTKRAWEIFVMFVTKASASFTPAFAHLYGEGDISKYNAVYGKLFFIVSIVLGMSLALGLTFNEVFVGLWVGSEFYAGNVFNVIFGLATVVSAITFTLFELLFSSGNIKGPAISQFVQSVARIVLLFLLMPHIGLLGIPASMLLTEFLIGFVYLSFRHLDVFSIPKHEMMRRNIILSKIILISVLFSMAWKMAPSPESWFYLFLQGLIFSIVLTLIYYISDSSVRSWIGYIFKRFCTNGKSL